MLQGELDEDEIADAMNGGARRGIFARASVATERGRTTLFVLNQEAHRAALRRAVAGTLTLPQGDEDSTAEPTRAKNRPNVFDLYEQEDWYDNPAGCRRVEVGGGGLSPEWTETAIREAALSGKRSWPTFGLSSDVGRGKASQMENLGEILRRATQEAISRSIYADGGNPPAPEESETGARCATVTAGWSAGYPWASRLRRTLPLPLPRACGRPEPDAASTAIQRPEQGDAGPHDFRQFRSQPARRDL